MKSINAAVVVDGELAEGEQTALVHFCRQKRYLVERLLGHKSGDGVSGFMRAVMPHRSSW
jgi:hypothetical protein